MRRRDALDTIQSVTKACVPAVDFHLHTTWTDGAFSSHRMLERAEACGLETVLFSEHARKTSGDWFTRFADEIRKLPVKKCAALVGVETKVEDLEGRLDCTEGMLKQCDLVMASVHRFPGEKGVVRGFGDVNPTEAQELEFRLACAILKNPSVDILAHPFGMCYRRFNRPPSDELMRDLITQVAKTTVAFEINCHYHPDPWRLIDWCRELGARISLGSNAHTLEEVGRIGRVLRGAEKT